MGKDFVTDKLNQLRAPTKFLPCLPGKMKVSSFINEKGNVVAVSNFAHISSFIEATQFCKLLTGLNKVDQTRRAGFAISLPVGK